MMAEHHLKTWAEPFHDVRRGLKLAELRLDDRSPRFEAGDVVFLHLWMPGVGFRDDAVCAVLSHVARGRHIPEGLAMLSLACVRPTDRRHPEQVRDGLSPVRAVEGEPSVVVARTVTA